MVLLLFFHALPDAEADADQYKGSDDDQQDGVPLHYTCMYAELDPYFMLSRGVGICGYQSHIVKLPRRGIICFESYSVLCIIHSQLLATCYAGRHRYQKLVVVFPIPEEVG